MCKLKKTVLKKLSSRQTLQKSLCGFKDLYNQSEDLKLLLGCALIIPLTWLFFLNWNGLTLIGNHDAIYFLFPFLKDFIESGSEWKNYLFRLNMLGGVKAHDVIGFSPLANILGYFGYSSIFISDLIIFFIQISFSFLCIKGIRDLTTLWRETPSDPKNKNSITSLIGLVWLTAFTPALAWRLSYGHDIITFGTLTFLSFFSLLLAMRSQSFSLTQACVILMVLTHAFPTAGQQTILYSVIFGLPIFLVTAWPCLRNIKNHCIDFSIIGCLFIGSLGISMVHVIGMIDNAFGGDTGRGFNGHTATYSYTTAVLWDWITSLPWGKEVIAFNRPEFLHHETNYPFGPLIFFFFLLPWKKSKLLFLGLGISLFLVLCFSMNITPISSALLILIPPLNMFRVPERAIYPVLYTALMLACSALLLRTREITQKSQSKEILLLGTGVLIFFLFSNMNNLVSELFYWTFSLLISGMILRSQELSRYLSTGLVFVILGAGSLSSFKERLLPFTDSNLIVEKPQAIRAAILEQTPQLESPLNRVKLNFSLGGFGVNSAYAMGLSSLDGYGFPLARFSKLTHALRGEKYEPTTGYFEFNENELSFKILKQLYHVETIAEIDRNQIRLSSLGPSLGAAWFSEQLVPVQSVEELASQLLQNRDSLLLEAKKKMWWISTDPAFQRFQLPTAASELCRKSQVLSSSVTGPSQAIHLVIENESTCPLTVASNYLSTLQASLVKNGLKTEKLLLFPAYGALTGLIVPPGAKDVWIEATPVQSNWATTAQLIGWLLVTVAFFLIKKVAR